eukprot:gnl/MRDRNA2_/MRDRNA2_243935_c0_seq1.p1 gnl/MRDRNA2_/MRDRNA2_243935_c0~~gnl/MRDRNA2_/MRDRNA2_243935_c0_seq1.p1  ORF type:complete len:304 (-),score=54.48 gnl/MRDRNA2_/MRDRNA2_243935_c0_seq1:133-1044(-)
MVKNGWSRTQSVLEKQLQKSEDSGWRIVRPKGFDESAFPSADAVMNWPAASARSVPGFPGALQISKVLPRQMAEQYVQSAEGLGFDNAHHPSYQNQEKDQSEESYRKNDRCVYQATQAQVKLLFDRLGPFLPPHLDAGTFGSWHLWGLNDMWRFYRYREGQSFPIHQDNMTAKAKNMTTWFTVLIYLSDGFKGGSTLMHDYKEEVKQEVVPEVGGALIFFHMPPWSPLHSGAPVSEGVKYVLRTDVMYKAEQPSSFALTPPYILNGFLEPKPLPVPAIAAEWEDYWRTATNEFNQFWVKAGPA